MKKKYNILLPVAGRAQRFLDEGYTMPKPLIMVNTKHIIDWALSSINIEECNLIFAARLDHVYNFAIDDILREKFGEDIKIVLIDHVTEGAVSTCLLAREYIDSDLPLLIYTPDVYFENQFDPSTIDPNLDGMLLTFKANSPAHSYVELDKNGLVIRTAEKEVISQQAAVGVYYFKSGKQFIKYADELIRRNIRVKNEFYLCPMYNLMIEDHLKIRTEMVEKMHVLGTPAELEFFVDHVVTRFGDKPVALCCDHSGFVLKEKAKKIMHAYGIPYIDFGTFVNRSCDYGDYVAQATRAMHSKLCDFGVGFCKTGQGVNIFANHIGGVRAALVIDRYMAEYAVRHNCANFFSIPSKYVNEDTLCEILNAWREASFDGGRHMTRMMGVADK
jgi:RpiB/LacA/LacB family sugar-phosphate isomerase